MWHVEWVSLSSPFLLNTAAYRRDMSQIRVSIIYTLTQKSYQLIDWRSPFRDVRARVLPVDDAHAPPEATQTGSDLSRGEKMQNPSRHVGGTPTKDNWVTRCMDMPFYTVRRKKGTSFLLRASFQCS